MYIYISTYHDAPPATPCATRATTNKVYVSAEANDNVDATKPRQPKKGKKMVVQHKNFFVYLTTLIFFSFSFWCFYVCC